MPDCLWVERTPRSQREMCRNVGEGLRLAQQGDLALHQWDTGGALPGPALLTRRALYFTEQGPSLSENRGQSCGARSRDLAQEGLPPCSRGQRAGDLVRSTTRCFWGPARTTSHSWPGRGAGVVPAAPWSLTRRGKLEMETQASREFTRKVKGM